MVDFSSFRGRIIQVTEALDVGDAVSNQVLRLDGLFASFGLDSLVATKFHHADLEQQRVAIEDVQFSEYDLVIYHHYLHAEHTADIVARQYCPKVLLYHNITPEDFYPKGSKQHQQSRRGREQLRHLIGSFDWFWGDSRFNVEELIAFGAAPEQCAVIPIIVDPGERPLLDYQEPGSWVCVGRIAPNKRQLDLVDLFSKVRASNPEAARSLRLVGGYNPNDAYVADLKRAIAQAGLEVAVSLTGKVSDQERNAIVAASSVNLSLSEHEGFGVPLVEAPLLGTPTIALARGAVAETLGAEGCFHSEAEIAGTISELHADPGLRLQLAQRQALRAADFSEAAVGEILLQALAPILPSGRPFRAVSVVICTYNRADHLDRCLDYLRYQSSPEFEVIVVNGPSDDRTAKVLEAYSDRIKVVSNPARNLSVSRNLGIEAAAGDIVAFIDDDAIPFDDWVYSILEEYNARPLIFAGLGGPAYYAGTFWFQAEDNGINKDCQVKVNIASDEIGQDGWKRYNTGTNATFRRDLLLQAGGFDEQFDYFLDETELCYRLQKRGHRIGYSPDVVVRHEFAQSHNRRGKFAYSWETICKNAAYFIAAYSERSGDDLERFLKDKFQAERIAPLDDAVRRGELKPADRDSYVDAIERGRKRGLEDFRHFPKTRRDFEEPAPFHRFATGAAYEQVTTPESRLHICIVSKEAPPFVGAGGVGTLYYHLASELLLMGHYVSFVVPSDETRTHRQGRLSVYFTRPDTIALPPMDNNFAGNLSWSLAATATLANIVSRDRRIDVVDSALWDAEALTFALIDPKRRPPLVTRLVTPFAVSVEMNNWQVPQPTADLFMAAEKRLINHAQAVIPISGSIASTMVQHYGLRRDRRWSAGYCGIAYWPFFDVNEGYDAFPELEKLPADALDGRKMVLFVGRLERRKGIDLILEAAETILEDPSAILVLAGRDTEDWTERFQQLARKAGAGADKRIILLGQVSDATREKLLAQAYCVLFPSRYESFGLVPLEAFVHGTPVIASRSGAVPEVVIDGECGLLHDPGDGQAIASVVRQLLHDPELRRDLSIGAKERVRHLSSRHSAIHSVGIYSKLIRDHRNQQRRRGSRGQR